MTKFYAYVIFALSLAAAFPGSALAQAPLSVPFSLEPTREQFDACTVWNNNNDEKTWTYAAPTVADLGYNSCFTYTTSVSTNADDWLVFPGIDITEKGMYVLTFDLATNNRAETFDIYMATKPSVADFYGFKVHAFRDFSSANKWTSQRFEIPVWVTGTIYFAVYAHSEKNKDHIYIRNFALERGDGSKPLAPEFGEFSFSGGNGTIAVVLPEQDMDGEYMTGNLQATLSIDEAEVQTLSGAPGEEVLFALRDLEKGEHTASVVVKRTVNGKTYTSDIEEKDFDIIASTEMRYTLPIDMTLGQANADGMTILDLDNDGNKWMRVADEMRVSHRPNNRTLSDDWMFLRPMRVTEADLEYILSLSIEARAELSVSREDFEVWLGTSDSPEAMTQKLISVNNFAATTFTEFSEEFSLPAPGDYVVGVHYFSAERGATLHARGIKVKQTERSSHTPGMVADLYLEADPTGARQATAYFTFPSKDVLGRDLDVSQTLTAKAVCGDNEATVEGKPGERGSVIIATGEGEYEVRLYCINASGTGLAASGTVKCGLDQPLTPRLLSTVVSEDNYSVSLRWRAVEEGVNDGVVNPDAMTYNLYLFNQNTNAWDFLETTDKTTFTFEVPSTQTYMDSYYIGIEAQNAPGSVSPSKAEGFAVLGCPYELPLSDYFDGCQLNAGPVSLLSSLAGGYAPSWLIDDPTKYDSTAACSNGYALIGHTAYSSGDSQVELPKFSTMPSGGKETKEVTITLDVYLTEWMPEVEILALCAGIEDEPVSLGKLDANAGNGWTTVDFKLPEQFLGKPWVAVRQSVNFTNYSNKWHLLDGYSFTRKLENGVDVADAAMRSISGGAGQLTATGYDGLDISVYAADGTLVSRISPASACESIDLPAGIYIVKAGADTAKVAVK